MGIICLKVIDVVLSDDDIQRLNAVSEIEMGFPHEFFKEEGVRLNNFGGFYDKIEKR